MRLEFQEIRECLFWWRHFIRYLASLSFFSRFTKGFDIYSPGVRNEAQESWSKCKDGVITYKVYNQWVPGVRKQSWAQISNCNWAQLTQLQHGNPLPLNIHLVGRREHWTSSTEHMVQQQLFRHRPHCHYVRSGQEQHSTEWAERLKRVGGS